jgi:hypothetical protein
MKNLIFSKSRSFKLIFLFLFFLGLVAFIVLLFTQSETSKEEKNLSEKRESERKIEPEEKIMTITSEGLNEIKINQKFKLDLVPSDFSKYYFVRYIGDGQPTEGLTLFNGQMMIFFASGPFQKAAQEEYLEPEAEKFASQALEALKEGLAVSEIVILGPLAKTEKGITVNSTFQALKENYPEINLNDVPDALRGNDLISCLAQSKLIPNVYFIFHDRCKQLKPESQIARIEIFTQEENEPY